MAEPLPTVLIVEDEESYADALVVGLKREGFLSRSPVMVSRRSPRSTPFVLTSCCST